MKIADFALHFRSIMEGPSTPKRTRFNSPGSPSSPSTQESLTGYLHDVSEIFTTAKTKKSAFEFVLQNASETFMTVACWSTHLHGKFKSFARSRLSVICQGRKNKKHSLTDFTVVDASGIQEHKVDFSWTSFEDPTLLTVDVAKMMDPETSVTIKGMLIEIDFYPQYAIANLQALDGGTLIVRVWGENNLKSIEKGVIIKCIAYIKIHEGMKQFNVNKLCVLIHENATEYKQTVYENKVSHKLAVSDWQFVEDKLCCKCDTLLSDADLKKIGGHTIAVCKRCSVNSFRYKKEKYIRVTDLDGIEYRIPDTIFDNKEITEDFVNAFFVENQTILIDTRDNIVTKIHK